MNPLALVLALALTVTQGPEDACTCPIGPGLDSGACPHCEAQLDALWGSELEDECEGLATDWCMCKAHPETCKEHEPELYREVFGAKP